jgi:acyl-CoA thioester hydrolase
LRLELWADQIRGASFRVCYDVFDGSALAAKAATKLVIFDFTNDRPRRLTAEERHLLQSFSGHDDAGTVEGGS